MYSERFLMPHVRMQKPGVAISGMVTPSTNWSLTKTNARSTELFVV